jgi:hypothetical protein
VKKVRAPGAQLRDITALLAIFNARLSALIQHLGLKEIHTRSEDGQKVTVSYEPLPPLTFDACGREVRPVVEEPIPVPIPGDKILQAIPCGPVGEGGAN